MFGFIEKLGVVEGLRKIYSGAEVLQKHMLLFVLVAVPAMLTTPLHDMSKTILTNAQFVMALLGLLGIAVLSVYIIGYLYGVMHNAFDDNKTELLPKFDSSWFKVFFKGFPIQLTWAVYLVIIFVVTSTLTAVWGGFFLPYSVRTISKISLSVGFLVFNIFVLILPFVYARFTENYDRKGLYNPILPIKYMCKAFKSFVLLLLTFAPVFVVIAVIGFLGLQNNVLGYLLTAVWSYLWTIMQYSANYCFVQIYKNEIKDK